MPAPVRIIFLYYAGLLLYDFSPSTGTCHCRAQEDVDNEHDKEHDSKCYAQVQQPWGVYTAFTQLLDHCKVSNGYRYYRVIILGNKSQNRNNILSDIWENESHRTNTTIT